MDSKIIKIVSDILKLSEEETQKYCKEVPEIDGYYFWNPVRGGLSVIINHRGERLCANSSISFEEHLKAFKEGRRDNMVDLAEIKRVYRLREKTSLELQKQLELIRKVLGNHFIYKDFEYFIPTEILDIDDVDDVGDGIVDILYIDGGLDVVLRHMDEELLRMNEEELKRVKETL